MRHPRQHAALVGDQQVAADTRRRGILLHAGILGVIALDGAGVIAGFNDGDEFFETGARRHEISNASGAIDQILGSGNLETPAPPPPRWAKEAPASPASPSTTGGTPTMLTADQP